MDNNMHFDDGVLDEAIADVNSRTKGLVKIAIDAIFDYLEGKVKDIPETIERLRNSPETEQRIYVTTNLKSCICEECF